MLDLFGKVADTVAGGVSAALEGAADGLTLGAKVVVAGGEVVAGTAVGVVKGAADGLEKVVDKVTAEI